jgi:hypothetical protein
MQILEKELAFFFFLALMRHRYVFPSYPLINEKEKQNDYIVSETLQAVD